MNISNLFRRKRIRSVEAVVQAEPKGARSTPPKPAPSSPFEPYLSEVELADPVGANGVLAFGIRWGRSSRHNYITLDEALKQKGFRITEVSESGSVPTLRVVNGTEQRVLLVAGEHLVGAKQDRVLNVSILVEIGASLDIPVTCVERGRWRYRTRNFSSSGRSSHGKLRQAMAMHAKDGYRSQGRPTSDQGSVWDEVSRKLGKLGTSSPSDALHQAYEDHRSRTAEAIAAVRIPDDCNGVVFVVGGQIAGADVFDRADTLQRMLPKLIQGYALDALEHEACVDIAPESVADWLLSASQAPVNRYKSPGVGDDYRFDAADYLGGGLVVDDHPVHVELYPPVNSRERPSRRHTVFACAGAHTLPPECHPELAIGATLPDLQAAVIQASGLLGLHSSTEMVVPVLASDGVANPAALLLPHFGGQMRRAMCPIVPTVRADERTVLDGTNPKLTATQETQLVGRICEAHPGALVRLVFTGCGLSDNWFSHWHADQRTAVISAYDWRCVTRAPLIAGAANAIIMHGWRVVCPGYDPSVLLHEESCGCPFDLCGNKTDIDHKLRRALVCGACRERLASMGVNVTEMQRAYDIIPRLTRECVEPTRPTEPLRAD